MFHIMLFQLSSPNGQVVTKACPNATSWWGLRSSIFASSWGRSPSPPRVRVSLEVDRPHGKAIAKCGYPRMYSIRRLLAACSWKSGLQGASASGLPVAIATCPLEEPPTFWGEIGLSLVPDSVIRDDSMIGRTYKVPMDAGFGEWFVSETPLLNNLPIKVFRSNQFWGKKTAEMIKELLWPEVNPCPLGRILRENMFHDIWSDGET